MEQKQTTTTILIGSRTENKEHANKTETEQKQEI